MKKKVLLVFVALFLLLLKIDVSAECTSDELESLKLEALNITTRLEFNKGEEAENEEDAEGALNYWYDLKIYNLNSNFYTSYGFEPDKNNEVTIKQAFIGGGSSGQIEIYASSKTKCPNQLVRTIKIQTPYYNKYSEEEECKEFSEYDICNPEANTSSISPEDFKLEIEKIRTKEQEQEKQNQKQEKNDFEKVLDYIKTNYKLIIAVFVVAVALIVIIVLLIKHRNRNKIKIDMGD